MDNPDTRRILILGATGMLGHKMMQVLSKKYSVIGTVRAADTSGFAGHPVFAGMDIMEHVDAGDIGSVERAIGHTNPDVVINCIGIVKQLPAANDPLPSIAINALFPHELAKICRKNETRLVHISTDCVFSGLKGNYSETDPSDATDLYGRTKYLGEVDYPGCLTLRTSIIGRELNTAHGLMEWFMSQEGKIVPGYKKAIFSGVTTQALSEIAGQVIDDYPALHGVRQVASEPISKFDLLHLMKDTYQLPITIEPEEHVVCDRSLNPEKFRTETDILVPSWKSMLEQMARDPTPYDLVRLGVPAYIPGPAALRTGVQGAVLGRRMQPEMIRVNPRFGQISRNAPFFSGRVRPAMNTFRTIS
jgi:dTDP-4-dehydrorhamnose reductase